MNKSDPYVRRTPLPDDANPACMQVYDAADKLAGVAVWTPFIGVWFCWAYGQGPHVEQTQAAVLEWFEPHIRGGVRRTKVYFDHEMRELAQQAAA